MTHPQRFVIVSNPASGRGRAAELVEDVADILKSAGRAVETLATVSGGDAQRMTRELVASHESDRPLCVVACGGDGTNQEIINGLLHAGADRATLGLLPAGRCNDFAKALGIGGRAERLARILLIGHTRRFDVGRVGDRYFCTIAAVGFDAAVTRFVDRMSLPLKGTPAYVYGTLRTLWRYETPNLTLRGDFGTYTGPGFLAATANTPCYGGALRIAPQASPRDGLMDVCLVSRIARPRVLLLLPRVMQGNHLDLPEVRMLRTRSLTIEAADETPNMEVWADGEPVGSLPTTIECVPGAVEVLVPPD